MRTILIIITAVVLLSSKCKRVEYDLLFVNNSGDSIIMAYKWHYDEQCNLQGITLKSGETHTEGSGKYGWENRLYGGRTHEIYVIDPSHYNTPTIYYNCDSIELKNKVLKHYVLTIEDLKMNNFIITYP